MKRLVAIFLILSAILTAQPSCADSPDYSSSSPHWPWIWIFDLGRTIKYYSPESTRDIALRWYASHVDATEVGMTTAAIFRDPGVEYFFNGPYLKSLNPTFRTVAYDFDLSFCQHIGCYTGGSLNTEQANFPEEWYLHFSESTTINFVSLQGQTIDTATIPGCPIGQALSSSCRVQTYGWTDYRLLPNFWNSDLKVYQANRILNEMSTQSNPIDTIFLDEHGPGFALTYGFGYQTQIISGGGIREYGGARPRNVELWGPYDVLDAIYNASIVNWLSYLSATLKAAGKSIIINTAGYSTEALARDQDLAAGGVLTELLHQPEGLYNGGDQYQQLIALISDLVDDGGTPVLYSNINDDGPPEYNSPGNFPSPKLRRIMWKLASYYMLKEPQGSPGRVYFCPDLPQTKDLSFMDGWLNAFEVNPGIPLDAATVYKEGDGAPVGCAKRNYKIFARNYSKSLILVRAGDDRQCKVYGDASGVTVSLTKPRVLLLPDGTFSPPKSSVVIRNGEALILFDPKLADSPFTISSVTANFVSATSLSVSWKSSTPELGYVDFGASRLNKRSNNEIKKLKRHKIVLKNLKRKGKYKFRIHSGPSRSQTYSVDLAKFRKPAQKATLTPAN